MCGCQILRVACSHLTEQCSYSKLYSEDLIYILFISIPLGLFDVRHTEIIPFMAFRLKHINELFHMGLFSYLVIATINDINQKLTLFCHVTLMKDFRTRAIILI